VLYIEQISYLIYLKLLDEEETNREQLARLTGKNGNGASLFPQQAARFRWQRWRFKSGTDLRDFLRDDVFPYMASLVKEEPQVAEYFRDAILEILDPNVLKQVVDEIDSIEFRKLGPDVKGDIFEGFRVAAQGIEASGAGGEQGRGLVGGRGFEGAGEVLDGLLVVAGLGGGDAVEAV